MKLKLISAFLAAFAWGAFTVQDAKALSCVQSFPVVGIVSDVSVTESYTEIVLDKFHTFSGADWGINNTISIDQYENIVREYIKNNFQLSEELSSEHDGRVGKISVPTGAFNQTQIKNGDVIINGPPFHVCDYRFTGLFTRDGELRSAIVNDNYRDYSYRDSKLEVETGKELECDKNDKCQIEVNFKLDGESFSLSPGQSYMSTESSIKAISLSDSSNPKKRSDGTIMFDEWGFDTYVTYVLFFPNSTIQPTPIPTPTPALEPKPLPESTSSVENLNFFQKIWHWFISSFR